MVELVIKGAEDLEKLARALKQVGDGALRRELLRTIRSATKPIVQAVKDSARETLPSSGGFAALIAKSRVSSLTRLSGKQVGVRIKATNQRNIRALNSGRLRHPLFGNKDHWYTQTVPAGWFTKPIEAMADGIRVEVSRDLAAFATKHLSN